MIVELTTLLAFVPAGVALNLTPGADMMFCLAQGMKGGARPAAYASAGVSAGAMVNVTLAGLGVGALIAAHPPVFEAIRWAGVLYLLILAYRTLRSPLAASDVAPVRSSRAFRDGMLVNISNPKVILFILAFLPQFIDPSRGSVLAQFLVLGSVFATTGFLVNAAVGYFAGGIGRVLARSKGAAKGLSFASAAIFCLLALRLVLEKRPA